MKTLVTPLDTRLHSIVVTRNALEPIPGVEAEVGLPLVGVKKSLGGQKDRDRRSDIGRQTRPDSVTKAPQTAPAVKVSIAEEGNETSALHQTESTAEPAVMDEAAIIEERRKRREAMRNKYRGQATPLLVQALHLGAESSQATPDPESSAAASPVSSTANLLDQDGSPAGTREASPASPQSPRLGENQSGVGSSPAAQDDMFGTGDADSPAEDEPSAADYDPTIDMQEERARHDSRLFKEDEQSVIDADKQVHEQATVESIEAAPKKPEFDMFADEDDDDMFAGEGPTRPKVESKTAQAFDAKMMDNWDDPEGYYITILGELIDKRYSVTENLGRGMFASVVRATDSKTGHAVAIKIVRNNESMRKAGVKELDILKDIAANDPDEKKHVIRMLRSFDHKGHLCMVFENMSMNLREVLKKFGRDIGINLKAVRAYAQQLFLGLGLLKKCQYLHADLKPDNILVNEARNVIKIADLGSASPITENATAPYLVSRFYRAPEVILGISYDYGIDMWSVGCTLFELYTGKILFTGRNNNNMLRTIMDCRGKFPHKLLRRGALTYDYFDDLLNFRSQESDKVTGRVLTKLIDIKAKPVRDLRSRLIPKGKKMDDQERKELELFLDLLDKCLDLRPEKRITPADALKHPFILRTK
ncbi:uncharacterized protein HMPREF1541_00896 [Cyphellophora europaea CBS 101466]|uniref:non-specific serine/threonine protein kinase n=1 Tax=Cyphellophora europaea (strain CBS 101466) TaxID=1220924 RepID=W2SFN0_CYPE1|nr:uncharacterized protein HMPREF1541_00896 [Cyphellophora europaea CBS 101466]ETN46709.1 hypothetical protein HMPREF1541_00896 [Cyphellophora europaea CBS 101466]